MTSLETPGRTMAPPAAPLYIVVSDSQRFCRTREHLRKIFDIALQENFPKAIAIEQQAKGIRDILMNVLIEKSAIVLLPDAAYNGEPKLADTSALEKAGIGKKLVEAR